MGKHNAELMYGPIDEVYFILDCQILDESELRAALMNAFTRIQRLEDQINQMSKMDICKG